MSERNALMFEVVRRGYDVDEVNAHLANVERQRGAELDRAQAVIRQKDAEIDRLRTLTAEVEQVKADRAEVDLMMGEASRKREIILDEASRAAREQTTLASKTSAGLRADTEKEMSALRRDTEAEMTELRSTLRQEADKKMDEARAEARRIESEAEQNAQRTEEDTLKQLAEFEANHEMEMQHRRGQADRDHSATIRSHRQTEVELVDRVNKLQTMLESLVGTLQAIAGGGLAILDATDLEQLNTNEMSSSTDVNLPGDDESVTESVFAPGQDTELRDTELEGAELQDTELQEEAAFDEGDHVDQVDNEPVDDDMSTGPEADDDSTLEPTVVDPTETVELSPDHTPPSVAGSTSRWRLISTP